MIEVCLVGTGGMMPLPGRWLSSLAVRTGGQGVLFDCGEGTQIALREAGWGFRAIDALCFSHLHADHVGGVVGVLFTLANSGREEAIDLYGPPGLAKVVAGQRLIAPWLPFEVRCHELAAGDAFQVGEFHGYCAWGRHKVPCLAYRLDLPRRPRFDPERARQLGVPVELWERLQDGQSVGWEGRIAQPQDVLGPPRRGLSVAYMTDTRPSPDLVSLAAEVDLLVCGATFGDPADQPRALDTDHMTFTEAAEMAKQAGARRLWLTHFSPAMPHPEEYLELAQSVFPATVLGHDGMPGILRFEA